MEDIIQSLEDFIHRACMKHVLVLQDLHDAWSELPYEVDVLPSKQQVTKAFRDLTLDGEWKAAVKLIEDAGYTITPGSWVRPAHKMGLKEGLDLAKAYIMLKSIKVF